MPITLKRIAAKFIFCDADIVEPVQKLINDITSESHIFVVKGEINGYKHMKSLLAETATENEFS